YDTINVPEALAVRAPPVLEDLRVEEELAGELGREDEGLGAPHPLSLADRPSGFRAVVDRRAIERHDPRGAAGPERGLEISAQVLALVEEDIILDKHEGIGVGPAHQELPERQEIARPGTDLPVAKRAGEVRESLRDDYCRIDEQKGV